MSLNIQVPQKQESLRPHISVIGVGGAGGNAVNNMIKANLEGANFVVANTDSQALEHSYAETRIQLGANVTKGLGAGASPEVGRAAAEEAIDELETAIRGSNMLFITAGMGGGTGTGAAPVVARLAREMGVLTVGVVTKPFHFEGVHRMRMAEQGLEELQKYVDTLIVIPNQNLFRVANEKTTFADAFAMADDVLHSGVRGITDLMTMPGLINLDFADIRAVMSEMGKAMMGTGEAEGDRRAVEAAESAISNPLLDDVSMKGARGVLINITGGADLTLFEVDEAANRIREEVDPEANIIFGAIFNEDMNGKMRVSVVATGVDAEMLAANKPNPVSVQQRAAQPVVRPASPKFAPEAIKPQPRPVMVQPVEVKKEPAPAEEPKAVKVEEDAVAPVAIQAEPVTEAKAAPVAAQPAFIPPKPVEPARQVEAVSFRREPEASVEVTEKQQPKHGPSFGASILQKVGKAFTIRAQDPRLEGQHTGSLFPEQPQQQPRAEQKEEYLDIPAFLRRQAN